MLREIAFPSRSCLLALPKSFLSAVTKTAFHKLCRINSYTISSELLILKGL